jgi:hypothetical protein
VRSILWVAAWVFFRRQDVEVSLFHAGVCSGKDEGRENLPALAYSLCPLRNYFRFFRFASDLRIARPLIATDRRYWS